MVPLIYYLHLGGAEVSIYISAFLTATPRFVNQTVEIKLIFIRILSPVANIVDTTALELKEKIAR